MTRERPANYNPASRLPNVWSGVDINRSLKDGTLDVERESGGDLHVGPSSLDVHLHPESKHTTGKIEAVNVAEPDSYRDWTTDRSGPVQVAPGEFCLGRTDEVFDMPASVMALLHGRSSVGRLGVFIENAGLVDRGFEGSLTLELFNPTDTTVIIPAQTRVGQLAFFKHDQFQGGGYGGKYDGQTEPETSSLSEDTDL